MLAVLAVLAAFDFGGLTSPVFPRAYGKVAKVANIAKVAMLAALAALLATFAQEPILITTRSRVVTRSGQMQGRTTTATLAGLPRSPDAAYGRFLSQPYGMGHLLPHARVARARRIRRIRRRPRFLACAKTWPVAALVGLVRVPKSDEVVR